MPAFGHDGILTAAQIATVAEYVRSLSGLEVPKDADLAAGADDLRRTMRRPATAMPARATANSARPT